MFVYSVKSKHIKIVLLVIFVVMTIISLAILSTESAQTGKTGMSIKASTHSERMAFLSQYGWELDEASAQVQEVVIPTEFDDTYKEYNKIQLAQGFDLTPFMGARAKRWTYIVKNYKGYENRECIHANILVCDGLVIGGDVCSVELDGFMHGFSKP